MFAYPPSGGISCNCVTSQQISWGRHGVAPYDDYDAWDDFAEVWWDPTFVGRGNDRIADGAPGHYRYMEGASGDCRVSGRPANRRHSRAIEGGPLRPATTIPGADPEYECKGCPGR